MGEKQLLKKHSCRF